MIAEDLILPDNLNYRDPVSYMAARWFDEPFQADVLSKALGEKFHITSVDEDRYVHADFWFDKLEVSACSSTRNYALAISDGRQPKRLKHLTQMQ